MDNYGMYTTTLPIRAIWVLLTNMVDLVGLVGKVKSGLTNIRDDGKCRSVWMRGASPLIVAANSNGIFNTA